MLALEKLKFLYQAVSLLKAEFLLKTDSGYPREEGDFVVSPQNRIGAPARISNTQTVHHAVGDVFTIRGHTRPVYSARETYRARNKNIGRENIYIYTYIWICISWSREKEWERQRDSERAREQKNKRMSLIFRNIYRIMHTGMRRLYFYTTYVHLYIYTVPVTQLYLKFALIGIALRYEGGDSK